MSGYNSSQRQWTTGHVRVLAAVLLALSMLIGTAAVALAQPTDIGARASQFGVICVRGTVIDHDEMPLKDFVVTATGPDLTGTTIVMTDTTDSHGVFEFPQPPNPIPPTGMGEGQWTFAVTLKDAYEMTPPYVNPVVLNLDYGKTECVQIRFKIRQIVPVLVEKIDKEHNLLDGWIITAAPGPNNWFAWSQTEKTGEENLGVGPVPGTAYFELTTGDWIFSEQPPKQTKEEPDPIRFRPIVPNTGTQGLKVTCVLNEARNSCEPVTIRFKNLIKNACIEAYKFDRFVDPTDVQGTVVETGLANWKITVKRTDDSVVASGITDALGRVKFINLLPGKYKVVEEVQPGWVNDPNDVLAETVYVVDVINAETCSTVQFYNIQRNQFCIEGRKFDTFGGIGLPGWRITAIPVKTGGYPAVGIDPEFRVAPVPEPDPYNANRDDWGIYNGKMVTVTNNAGDFKFVFPESDYRIPGAAYKICEQESDGWLPHTPLCQTVYLPKHPGACAVATAFENQQVGHWETVVAGKHAPSPYSNLPETPGVVNAGPSHGGYGGHGGYPSSSGAGCSTTYTAQPGDSLFGIGAMYGVPGGQMLRANPWVYSRPNYYLYTGDVVCIP